MRADKSSQSLAPSSTACATSTTLLRSFRPKSESACREVELRLPRLSALLAPVRWPLIFGTLGVSHYSTSRPTSARY